MKRTHSEIAGRIAKLDLGALYPGFHPFRFALYDDKTVCFGDSEIPWDSRFMANTAINYDGETIAIWNMKSAGTDMDILASKLVHEMLHAFQLESEGTVYPDNLFGVFYPRDLDNFTLRFLENQLLAGLAEKFDAAAWAGFKAARAGRLQRHREAADYEIKTEAIEGAAQFVELGALKRLSPDLYRRRLDGLLSGLRSPEKLFDARLLSYDTGSLLLTVAADNGLARPDWEKEKPGAAAPAPEVPGLRAEFDRYFGAIDAKVRELISAGRKLDLAGKELALFDPYNARSSGEYIYHPNFIGVSAGGGSPEFLTGACVTKMAGRSRIITEAWRGRPAEDRG